MVNWNALPDLKRIFRESIKSVLAGATAARMVAPPSAGGLDGIWSALLIPNLILAWILIEMGLGEPENAS